MRNGGFFFSVTLCPCPYELKVSEELCRGKASPKHLMEGFSRHNSSLIGRKYQAKFENDCISRSGHRFKITQPNLMILISFSFAEDVTYNDVNTYDIFGSQGTENLPFRFFFGHPV